MSSRARIRVAHRLAMAFVLGASLVGLASVGTEPAAAGTQPLDLSVHVSLVPGAGATLRYRGTFSGSPLGRGNVDLRSRLGGAGGATVTYVLTTRQGTMRGSANVTLAYGAATVTYHGTASITAGTGAYRRIRARDLHISGRSPLSAESTTLRLTGQITG